MTPKRRLVTKRRLVNLYLCLICFIGFITVFFVDGYMGIYDTLYIIVGEREQKIELHQWLRLGGTSIGDSRWGEKALFRYEIGNHEFSTYSDDIEVSLWHDEELVRTLLSQHIQIARFDQATLEWVLDTVALEPEPPPPFYPYEYYVMIKSGEIERELKFYIAEPRS